MRVELDRVSTSCGYAVPFMDYRDERETLQQWAGRQDEPALADYRTAKNAVSVDGLPGLPRTADAG